MLLNTTQWHHTTIVARHLRFNLHPIAIGDTHARLPLAIQVKLQSRELD
jgi:hypothetical protein